MIETPSPAVLAERREPTRQPLEQMKCSRCGGTLARVALVVGSVVEMRCHHSYRKPDGKRETCGWINTVRPSR